MSSNPFRRNLALTYGTNWNSEVLALEAKQALADVVQRHRGMRNQVRPRKDGTLECFCGNIWKPTHIDPLNKRCPVVVGFEDLCLDAGCTRNEIQAVWDGFTWVTE